MNSFWLGRASSASGSPSFLGLRRLRYPARFSTSAAPAATMCPLCTR